MFGNVVNGAMVLNATGQVVADEWLKSADIRNEIELDEFVVMPNHLHAVVFIVADRRGDRPVAPTKPGPRPQSIASLMAGFKSAATKRVNAMRQTPGLKLWQRNYYEHVIRNENGLNRIREYIVNNPLQWELDPENPNGRGDRPVALP